MAAKKIYLVRHGQTKYNNLGIVQGRGIDASLNEKGRWQAERFYQFYNKVPFEKIYTSTLKRTRESVMPFIQKGIPYVEFAGLDEISWGNHEGVEASFERNEYFRELVAEWNKGNTNVKIEGGESPEDVAQRQKPVIDDILNAPEATILVCMHGRAIRVVLCQLLGLPLSKMDDFSHNNLGLYLLKYDNNKLEIELANDIEHLKE